jgi:hypothetical protein
MGSTLGDANARMWLAWSPEGLYGAVDVQDSRGWVEDAERFWTGDVLEIFLSCFPDKRGATYQKGDHQLWMVPLFKENRAYAGRWKVKEEIAATQFNLPGVKSAVKRTSKGYIMEFMIPTACLDSAALNAGSVLGMNVNLTVKGLNFDREIYWPRKKAAGVPVQPKVWGTVKLVE